MPPAATALTPGRRLPRGSRRLGRPTFQCLRGVGDFLAGEGAEESFCHQHGVDAAFGNDHQDGAFVRKRGIEGVAQSAEEGFRPVEVLD